MTEERDDMTLAELAAFIRKLREEEAEKERQAEERRQRFLKSHPKGGKDQSA